MPVLKKFTKSLGERRKESLMEHKLEDLSSMMKESSKHIGSLRTIDITREEFDLLDVEDEAIYRIIEDDGSVTIHKGENI